MPPNWARERGLESRDKPGNTWPGRLISLRMEMGSSSAWLGSAWAALCGAVASGQMGLEAQSLLLLLLVLFLVDPILGGVRRLVLGTDWFAPLAGGHLSRGEGRRTAVCREYPGEEVAAEHFVSLQTD